MHPLVRDLYKRVVWIGRDYPTGWPHVQSVWKAALRNPDHCPLWYTGNTNENTNINSSEPSHRDITAAAKEDEMVRAVHKGRWAIKEMMGVIQLKKYRSLKQRYDTTTTTGDATPHSHDGTDDDARGRVMESNTDASRRQ